MYIRTQRTLGDTSTSSTPATTTTPDILGSIQNALAGTVTLPVVGSVPNRVCCPGRGRDRRDDVRRIRSETVLIRRECAAKESSRSSLKPGFAQEIMHFPPDFY